MQSKWEATGCEACLATAWLANSQIVQAGLSPLTFVCADGVLVAMPEAEGLVVESPNSHP